MRAQLAIVVVLSGVLALNAAAQTDHKRTAKPHERAVQPRSNPKAQVPKEQVECAAARHEDPTGHYAGYPCWAREAFARGSQGNRE
jgi:hypothetical protein